MAAEPSMKKCKGKTCLRRVTADYCCALCVHAHRDGLQEYTHNKACDTRHVSRKEWKE